MNLPFETLVLVALVGLAVGWFFQTLSQESRLGPLGEMIAGLVGAFAAAAVAPHLGGPAGSPLGLVVGAAVGAVVLLLGARHLAEVWASQVSAPTPVTAKSDVAAGPSPAAETEATTARMRGSTPQARRSRAAAPREVPQPRPWFRES